MPELIINLKVMKNFLIEREQLIIQLPIDQPRMFCLKYIVFNIKVLMLLSPTL